MTTGPGKSTKPIAHTKSPASSSPAAPELSPAAVRRVVVASFIGTTIEWYDFFLYGTAAALVFNKLFFPKLEPLAGTMAALATYSVGFFARPVGGVVFAISTCCRSASSNSPAPTPCLAVAATKNSDGSLRVLALVQNEVANCVSTSA